MKILVNLCFIALIVTPIFFVPISVSAQQVETKECIDSSKKKTPFRVISVGRSMGPDVITGIRVVVKQRYYNRDDMLQLAQNIKTRFCNESHLTVTIFDDSKVAKIGDIVFTQITGKRIVPEFRGYYSLDRSTGFERLSYSEKRGNPPDEVDIMLP
jgi:hypothetical protein